MSSPEKRIVNFLALRSEALNNLNAEVKQVNQVHEKKRGEKEEELEQIDYNQNEGLQTQKELVKNLEEKRGILAEIETENKDFQVKLGVKAKEKQTLRNQIVEVEKLVQILSFELENIDLNTKKINMVSNKEDELVS